MIKFEQFFSLRNEMKEISSLQPIAENMFIVGKVIKQKVPQVYADFAFYKTEHYLLAKSLY